MKSYKLYLHVICLTKQNRKFAELEETQLEALQQSSTARPRGKEECFCENKGHLPLHKFAWAISDYLFYLQAALPDLDSADADLDASEPARPAVKGSKRRKGLIFLAAAGLVASSLYKPEESAAKLFSALSVIAMVHFSK